MPEPADAAGTAVDDAAATVEWRLFADLVDTADASRIAVGLSPDATVGDALDALVDVHPDLAEQVLDDGDLADHVTLLRDGTRIEDRAAPVEDGDELALMPPVSGG